MPNLFSFLTGLQGFWKLRVNCLGMSCRSPPIAVAITGDISQCLEWCFRRFLLRFLLTVPVQ